MSQPDDSIPIGIVRTGQIITAALILGVVIFTLVVLFAIPPAAPPPGPAPNQTLPVLSLMAGMAFIACVPLSFIVPRFATRSALTKIAAGTWQPPRSDDPRLNHEQFASTTGKLLAVWQSSLILGLAMLEGCAFWALTAFMIEAQPAVLVVAGIAIALMLVRFPTMSRVDAWLEDQARMLAEMTRI
jgi:hypothetical protein